MSKIVDYLRRYGWEWIPEDKICKGANCTHEDLLKFMDNYMYMRMVETRDNNGVTEYRYIGNQCSMVYRAMIYLRDMYPKWCTSSQITKAMNLHKEACFILVKYRDLAPYEKKKILSGTNYINHYRYVPNDSRSIQVREYKPSTTSIKSNRKCDRMARIVNLLKSNPNQWMTARSIIRELEIPVKNGGYISSYLKSIMDTYPQIESSMYKQLGVLRYRYNEVTA